MKLKVNWPPTPMCAVCLCAGIPSMHSASAQLDGPRCQAAVVAYRTPDDWSLQGHALPVACFQVPGSSGSRGSAFPLYLQPPTTPLTKPTAITAAKELWINRLSLSGNIFTEDRSCIFSVACVVFCLCGKLESMHSSCGTARQNDVESSYCVKDDVCVRVSVFVCNMERDRNRLLIDGRRY